MNQSIQTIRTEESNLNESPLNKICSWQWDPNQLTDEQQTYLSEIVNAPYIGSYPELYSSIEPLIYKAYTNRPIFVMCDKSLSSTVELPEIYRNHDIIYLTDRSQVLKAAHIDAQSKGQNFSKGIIDIPKSTEAKNLFQRLIIKTEDLMRRLSIQNIIEKGLWLDSQTNLFSIMQRETQETLEHEYKHYDEALKYTDNVSLGVLFATLYYPFNYGSGGKNWENFYPYTYYGGSNLTPEQKRKILTAPGEDKLSTSDKSNLNHLL
jgi:hypothetical protein